MIMIYILLASFLKLFLTVYEDSPTKTSVNDVKKATKVGRKVSSLITLFEKDYSIIYY